MAVRLVQHGRSAKKKLHVAFGDKPVLYKPSSPSGEEKTSRSLVGRIVPHCCGPLDPAVGGEKTPAPELLHRPEKLVKFLVDGATCIGYALGFSFSHPLPSRIHTTGDLLVRSPSRCPVVARSLYDSPRDDRCSPLACALIPIPASHLFAKKLSHRPGTGRESGKPTIFFTLKSSSSSSSSTDGRVS